MRERADGGRRADRPRETRTLKGMNMRTTIRKGWIWCLAVAVAAALAAVPAPVSGQEVAQEEAQEDECQLQPSEAVSVANEKIQEAENAPEEAGIRRAYQEALDALGEELEAGSDNPATYVFAARAHIGLEEYERADELLRDFVEMAPNCQQAARNVRYNAWVGLYNEGIQAYQAGNEDEALEAFETAGIIHADARAYNNAAILHQQRGNTEQAIDLYRKAIEAGGEEEQVMTATQNLAEILSSRGETEEAISIYRRYLERNPGSNVARLQYGVLLSESGQADSAAAIVDEVLAQPDLSADDATRAGVVLFNAEDYGRAVDAFRRAREANPYSKEGMENLVNALVQAESPGEAVPIADTLVAWYPYDEGNYRLHANALAQSDRGEQALQVMQQAENLSIAFEQLQMGEGGDGTYVIRGVVRGTEAAAGTTMSIPFEFLSADGTVVASEDLEIGVPAAGQADSFRLEVRVDSPVAGFRYRKAGSDGIQD